MDTSSSQVTKVPLTKETTNMTWKAITLMAFMTVWGFGNVVNGYAYFNGVKSIVSWVIVFVLYFIPYSLIVGELGSTFKESGAGVSAWIEKTFSKRLAYYAGWTYWVVHMPYISQKPLNVVIAASWAIYGDKRLSTYNIVHVQIVCIIIFLCVLAFAQFGVKMVKHFCSVAGMVSIVLSFMFILMAVSAPAIRGTEITVNAIPQDLASYIPDFNFGYFASFSILIFAVGGCEKISPYVNKMDKPGKDFPKSIIFMTIMVVVCAVIGTIALALMFDPLNPPKDMVTNGAYQAFQQLGNWYGVGDIFVKIYALSIAITNFAVMILSIDAPLRILIESSDEQFIPAKLKKQNKHGTYTNGTIMITIIVLILLIIPLFGIGGVNDMVSFLIKLNSVCMPLRYLWVFLAYFGLKRLLNQKAEYVMTKNALIGKILGAWCFGVTALFCILGMHNNNIYIMILNVLTPFVLIGLGLIMPYIAKKQREKLQN